MIIALRSDSQGVYPENRTETIKRILTEVKMYDYKQIEKIIDHKGILQVYWKIIPTDNDKYYFKKLWECFNEYNVEHYLINFIEL